MNRSIAHRGPDDQGVWFDRRAGVGLAHRRLSIIDLSPLGRQPMWDADERVAITYNGELYNYRELRRELVAAGYAFANETDTEVILNLYLRDGPEMLSQLSGMFAFALWDTRSRELLLARDRAGIKPLYLAETSAGLAFASEAKALLHEPSLPRDLDRAAIVAYMSCLWSPGERTMLRSVRKLEPGHALFVREGRIRTSWAFRDMTCARPDASLSASDAAAELRRTLEGAVERQMVADVPVGAFLSGGLDSSALVALARRHSHSRLSCFTMDFDAGSASGEGMTEDIGYARQVAKHLDVDLHEIRVGPEMIDQLDTMLYHLDEPQADPAAINAMLICGLARQHGVKVLLSGTGGDDLLTGYRRHFAILHEGWWRWMPSTLLGAIQGATARLPVMGALGRRVARGFQYVHLEGAASLASYFYYLDPELARQLLNDAPLIQDVNPEGAFRKTLERVPEDLHPLDKLLYLETKHFLPDHNLNYTDKVSMAQGIEVRVPLLDDEVIDFAARIPFSMKQRRSVGKWIFKKAMEPVLPRNVIYRRKTGFGVPLRYWLRHSLRERVEALLSRESLAQRGLFDVDRVRQLVEDNQAGRIDAAYTVLSLVCIESWCRQFLDAPTPRVPQSEVLNA